jgi:hypothetical protein
MNDCNYVCMRECIKISLIYAKKWIVYPMTVKDTDRTRQDTF